MNKQLKSPRLIILVMILSLMSVLVAGCGDDKYCTIRKKWNNVYGS